MAEKKLVINGKPLVDLEGSRFMRLENYDSILELTDTILRLKMPGVIYEISGKKLQVRGVTRREIFLEGELEALVIKKEEKR